ncbi:YARHG domain-containing protein [Pedobacter terrae]|nr:YARHG domain-containing protein [Pedobacter terrae]
MKKMIYILFLISTVVYGQSKSANNNCPCSISSEISNWKPQLAKGFDTKATADNFAHSLNGMYLSEDRDSLYQIKIIIDAKAYGTFVHFQHLSFSKAKLLSKQVTTCEQLPNVHDGGWINASIFSPVKAINKKFAASTFFLGESNFRINKTSSYRLYKCDKETKFGIFDLNKQRYYRKVHWEPEGSFTEISLVGFIQNDLKRYSKQQLAEMKNAVYARYNYAFKGNGKWYAHFNKKPGYRWNYFKDITPFITTLEKDNIEYITGFEGAEYYDNQKSNDFLDFWEKLRTMVPENDTDKLNDLIEFPFTIKGVEDGIPELKVSKQQFASVWPMLLEQENFGINGSNKPVSSLSKSVFNKADAFAAQMLHTKSNNIANLVFQKMNGLWKVSRAYADPDLYPKLQRMLTAKKVKPFTKKNQ